MKATATATWRRTGTVLPAVALAAVLAMCAGCDGTPPRPAATPTATPAPPLPAGAVTTAPSSTVASAPNCGDPTASLRPTPSAANGPSVQAIRSRGYLTVGLDTGSNLFSFRDPLTGTIEGFDVDIAKEVARDIFGDPQRVQFRILNDTERIRALQNHQVDLVVKTMTITCARRRDIAFSTEYYLAHQRILVMKPAMDTALGDAGPTITGLRDLDGRSICTGADTTSLDNIHRLLPRATIMTVHTWADCLIVLQQREVDGVTTDDALLAGLAQQDPHLEIVGPDLSDEPYGIGISSDRPDLVRFVNSTLDRIRHDGTWDRLYRRWLSILGPSPGPPSPHYQEERR